MCNAKKHIHRQKHSCMNALIQKRSYLFGKVGSKLWWWSKCAAAAPMRDAAEAKKNQVSPGGRSTSALMAHTNLYGDCTSCMLSKIVWTGACVYMYSSIYIMITTHVNTRAWMYHLCKFSVGIRRLNHQVSNDKWWWVDVWGNDTL